MAAARLAVTGPGSPLSSKQTELQYLDQTTPDIVEDLKHLEHNSHEDCIEIISVG